MTRAPVKEQVCTILRWSMPAMACQVADGIAEARQNPCGLLRAARRQFLQLQATWGPPSQR